MSATQIVEKTRNLIIAHIKSNIVAELAAMRADRSDTSVNLDPPLSYFIFDGAHTYQCPAIFVVVDSAEIPDEIIGPNHVNADVRVYVTIAAEGQDEAGLTIKTDRYQAALFKVLQWQTLVDVPNNVKIKVLVKRFQFSPLYTKKRTQDNMGNFRKEVVLELEVKHYENPTT